MNTGGATYKQGIVAESKPGFCRVRFDDLDSMVTAWLPVLHPKTQNDKAVWTLDIGEHVSCLMDGNMEDGCVLGAIYSDVDTPPVSSASKFCVQFSDGGSVEYDRAAGVLTVVATTHVIVRAPSITHDAPETTCTGNLTVQGLLTYQGGMAGSGGSGSAAVIQGNVAVTGNINATGSVQDGAGNSNHHTHP
jgi:phage baseplate assembly protein V